MLDRGEFAAWLRLLETPGLGRDGARRLLAAFGSPEGVLGASSAELNETAGPTITRALARAPDSFDERLAAALTWWDGGEARHIINLGDADYPEQLLQSPDPPLLLYVLGDLQALKAESVAVVGSRHASAQGVDHARAFAQALADAGLVVVSGLALGIDAAAHEGALRATAGRTVAVVGTGLDRVYPSRHRPLAQRIAKQGALVSEFAPGTPALPPNFPLRNRIIAGLSRGTLVVEAALRSGSLITARLASEAGREVYAVPGSIASEHARGCHALIRQGAMLVESAQEIVDDLRGGATTARVNTPIAMAEADPLLDALGADPMTLDTLMARTGFGAAELSARLLELELQNRVARLPGGLFQRRGLG
jgi:DNA processing protein